MKKIGVLFFSLLLFVIAPAQKARKALFVIVDGISADVIEKVSTPALDSIAVVGGYTRAHVGGDKNEYSQTPTVSAVGYNSLLTGTWVNKHNIWGNDIAAPNYNYYSIFRLFKEKYPAKKTAVFSSWQDNRTKLVGEGLEGTGKFQLEYHYDGLELDTINYPHDKARDFMHRIDESVVSKAVDCIKNEAPDLSWVYLEYTDDMGHAFGDHEKFYKAVEIMDGQISKLWQALQYRMQNNNEDWVIYITTDHGREAKTGRGHGGQSDRERSTWIVTNAKGLNDYFKAGNPGIVDIMPSMASFLNLPIARNRLMEIDGIPLTGKLSAVSPVVVLSNDTIIVRLKAMDKKGSANIWISTTNQFKEGGNDNYILATTVPVVNEVAMIDVSKFHSSLYKIVIETPYNFLNRWIMTKADSRTEIK